MANGANEGTQRAAQLINDLQDISFAQIGLIMFGTWLVSFIARKALPS
jgi:hypothetical protein